MTAGEQWAADELAQLRTGGFTPRALAAFLVASDRRAREVRRDRPALARRARAWDLTGAVAYVAVLRPGRGSGRGPRAAVATAAWWTTVALMLDWHLGMVESTAGEPRNLGAADALTLARAWLVPLIAAGPEPALVLLAAATDALDGPLARASVPTRAGRDLEGLVDLAVLSAGLSAASRRGTVAPAVLALELARVSAGFAYGVAAYFARAQPPATWVLRAGRATTPVRAAGLLAATSGRRGAANVLVGGGSAASLALLTIAARAARAGAATTPGSGLPARA